VAYCQKENKNNENNNFIYNKQENKRVFNDVTDLTATGAFTIQEGRRIRRITSTEEKHIA